MAITVLNSAGFAKLSQYTGNPFVDMMIDLQDLFNTINLHAKAKPYIDKYSDTSLSDLRDTIKANLPEAIDENGSINFIKLEELASQGNKIAEAILGVRNQREQFANASLGEKLLTLNDRSIAEKLTPILSGELITKQAKVMKNLQAVETAIKKLGLPPELESLFLSKKRKNRRKPRIYHCFIRIFISKTNC